MFLRAIACIFAFSITTFTTAQDNPISTLYQFPHGSWLENLATGPRNSILTTRLDIPTLYQITPPQTNGRCPSSTGLTEPSVKLIQTFPSATGTLGIAEFAENHYAVVVGNFSLETSQSTPGSYSIWDVYFTGSRLDRVSAKKIVDIPEAAFLNGMTVLDPDSKDESKSLLISDSQQGNVYRLDPETGEYAVILEDESMNPPNGTNIGINGIHTVSINNAVYLYYTNSLKETVNRVRIDPVTGRAIGAYTTLATGIWGDDFAVDPASGDLFVTGNFENVVTRVGSDGVVKGVIGAENQLTVAGGTSALFGGVDGRTLYVATSGALAAPVNGTVTEGAKIVGIRVDHI
ncbi:hypothetical protein BJY04DRAFT_233218 [Aspergillus karnatakaensis]|uniref:uncharacterized protein n=1 Tax=Aspergillus karnatakaensis TaxID=1810916 RepID=UPI003CCD0C12